MGADRKFIGRGKPDTGITVVDGQDGVAARIGHVNWEGPDNDASVRRFPAIRDTF